MRRWFLFADIEKSRLTALFATHLVLITLSPHIPDSDGIFALFLRFINFFNNRDLITITISLFLYTEFIYRSLITQRLSNRSGGPEKSPTTQP
jgi:hypothetical protein